MTFHCQRKPTPAGTDSRGLLSSGQVLRRLTTGGLWMLLALVFCSAPLLAKEDTAHLTFKKGKPSKRDIYLHKIKKGDTLFSLVSSIYQPDSGETRKQIFGAIQTLNPSMKSVHVIYAGQTMRLPKKHLFSGLPAGPSALKTEGVPAEKAEATSPSDAPLPLSTYRMTVIREVLERMNGAVTTSGHYYIPLPQSGQITVDCSRIPVVELADGSVVLLDFAQRMSPSLRKMIQAHWPNHHPVTVSLREESPTTLQKVLQPSRTYSMTKMLEPLEIGTVPRLQFAPGWLIFEKRGQEARKAIQLVTFLKERRLILPKSVTEHAKRNGLVITDFMEGHGIANPPDIQKTDLSLSALTGQNNLDLCAQVLSLFHIQPARNIDMKIFDQERDGFNLAIMAEMLVKHENRQILFHTRPLPPQFYTILLEHGVETVLLTDQEPRRTVIEKTLTGLGISYEAGDFSFPLPQQVDNPRGFIRFAAVRFPLDRSLQYLIDFDMDPDIHQLLHHQWHVRLIKY